MKTCCPNCQTIFRITPEHLKARAGRVRCGQCRTVFNALDALLEDAKDTHTAPSHMAHRRVSPAGHGSAAFSGQAAASRPLSTPANRTPSPVNDPSVRILLEPTQVSSGLRAEPSLPAAEDASPPPMSDAETQAFGKAAGLIMPREITETPGYDKWSSGVMAESPTTAAEKPPRWPYALAAVVLLLALLGQLAFHFRGELAIRAPTMRPALTTFSRLFGAEIPLPRHSELISIEASDLQTDPAHANLLTLNATLRNRAAYAQAFPLLELTLTNTDDNAIARRILSPADYLPARLKNAPAFAANTDIAVHLWVETTNLSAAGYRLYVFYP